eukprot:TRINITY_DN5026_c0_g2_i1.p1 TRINITY_DN5026_c0_g2~~TRINITY_DN5026_c0_g2_i1.p1  ORF type:complete len:120 (-),score=22.44 TRINITY_DN5026_c0_g2_i1:14-373(-)
MYSRTHTVCLSTTTTATTTTIMTEKGERKVSWTELFFDLAFAVIINRIGVTLEQDVTLSQIVTLQIIFLCVCSRSLSLSLSLSLPLPLASRLYVPCRMHVDIPGPANTASTTDLSAMDV